MVSFSHILGAFTCQALIFSVLSSVVRWDTIARNVGVPGVLGVLGVQSQLRTRPSPYVLGHRERVAGARTGVTLRPVTEDRFD